MHRRSFLKLAGCMAPLLPARLLTASQHKTTEPGQRIFKTLLAQTDRRIPSLLQRQETNRSHRWVGAVMDPWGIHAAGETARFIRTLSSVIVEPASRYFQDSRLIEPLLAAAGYLVRAQHDDGTIDLHTTNFNSPPDTGFVVEQAALAYTLLQRRPSEDNAEIRQTLQTFMLAAGKALSTGGIHTPNHRWVVCMALARLHTLFPDPSYLRRIDQWLAEKIDIDPDGQFHEKSSAIYSPLTDRCLITMARLLNREELFEPVRRNLDMTLYYLHADGEIVTEASQRQDQYRRGRMAAYYYPFLYMALKDQNGRYAALVRMMEESEGESLAEALPYLQEDPGLQAKLPALQPLPENFSRVFSHSHLARIRRGQVSATVLAQNPCFFSFHKGSAALEAVRLASAFFGKGQFKGDALQAKDGLFLLQQNLEGPYFQPLPTERLQQEGNWSDSNRRLRPQSEIQHLHTQVSVAECDGRFELTFTIQGTENVPVAIELAFREGGCLQGVTGLADIERGYLLEKGMGKYLYDGREIEFGPGLADHRWTQLRGSLPKMNSLSVYLTGFTPFVYRLKIS
ncbi:MAG TPA: hypothetical protein PK843_15710 [bacterium]|nr:hypothetical protein [bacterium]HPN35961.1 hypothetical protein [bacterium]